MLRGWGGVWELCTSPQFCSEPKTALKKGLKKKKKKECQVIKMYHRPLVIKIVTMNLTDN